MTSTPLMTFSALFWLTATDAVDTSLIYPLMLLLVSEVLKLNRLESS